MSARFAFIAMSSWLLSATPSARADSMDLALGRLVTNARDCSSADGSGRFVPATPETRCLRDDVAFKRLVSQLGFALAPSAMHAARTTGYGGFELALEASYSRISNDADYWQRGTRGASDPATNRAPTRNADPSSVIQQYSLRVRKGFGFGFEGSGVLGFVPHTSLVNGGADLRLALLEGFRTGALGRLPDIAVGAGVRSVTGTPELALTTVAIDAQISKPFVIAGSSEFTPWLGYQYLWIFGDSGSIDLTPGTSAIGACNDTGSNLPGNPDRDKTYPDPTGEVHAVYDGQPVCNGGSARDFGNDTVFSPVRVHRQRLILGMKYRYEVVVVGAQFTTDLLRPSDANAGANKIDLAGESRQWTLAWELGAIF